MIKYIFWFSIIMILYTYLGYPVLIAILAKVKDAIASVAQRSRNDVQSYKYPTVSMIIPVYNEEHFIQNKIENCMSLDYPKDKLEILIGSDGSIDRTNEIIKKYKGIKSFISKERRGKPTTINELVKASNGEILLFTDARQIIDKDAVNKLVRHFSDDAVGCVSGGLAYKASSSIVGSGIGSYWKYEKFLREKESAIYSMIGATGALYAARRELFEPLPRNIILDDMYTPFVVVKKGYRALFDGSARAYDVFAETPRDEHKRKVRTLSGNYQIFFKMPDMLNPLKSKIAFQIISHKLMRVLIPFFMFAAFVSNLFLITEPIYGILFATQALFYIIVLIEALLRRHIKGMLGVPYLFCVLNFSALVGFLTFIFKDIDIKWEKALYIQLIVVRPLSKIQVDREKTCNTQKCYY